MINTSELIERRTLVQINATIIAGMLIFLTIGDFEPVPSVRDISFFFIISGFLGLFASMMLCFATGNKGIPYSSGKLSHVFNYAEISFLFGIMSLFVSVTLILYMRLYPNA